MPLIYLCCAWVAGIFLGSNLNLSWLFILTGLIPLPLLFFAHQQKKIIILISLGLIIFFTAAPYSHTVLKTVDDSHLNFYNDRGTVEIKGMVASDPEVRDKSTHLKITATDIKVAEEWREVSGTVLVFVPRYPAYEYGDTLLVTGKLETPPQLDDFDYQNYLAHQGIYSTMLYPQMAIVARGKGCQLMAGVYSVRNHVAQTLAKVLPEPQASLSEAIILGIRGMIPPSLKSDFARTGTAHLLAISGLHLGIIAGILLSIGIWLFGRRHYLYIWLALGVIWLYALLTGMHPPVVRGAIMASLFLAAELLGRQRSAITALTLAAAVMVGISPYILGDAAFQLSFLAMTGLVFLFPKFRNLGRRLIKNTLGEEGVAVSVANISSDTFSATMGAIIAVWPVVAYYFGIISLVGPLATFLVLPALPGVIIAGALTGILGFFFLPAAQAMGWLTWLFLSYMIVIISGLAAPSVSSLEAGSIDTSLIWVYYSVLATTIWLSNNWPKFTRSVPKAAAYLRSGASTSLNLTSRVSRKWLIPPLLIIAILVSFTAATMPDDDLRVSFLNVGEGDAILIQTGTQQVLIDGGPSSQAISLELGSKMPFWDRTIELVILTHPHQDHLAGLVAVLQRFRVEQVLFSDFDDESPLYDQWLEIIKAQNIKSTTAQAGQQVDLGKGVIIKVINPPPALLTDTQSDMDNNGIVLRLSKGDISFLLTADIMREAELELLTRRAELSSTVLKVAHHGSDTSTTEEFLAVVNPQLAVISAGADNKFGHPSEAVMERLQARTGSEKIYRTDLHGTIEFTTDGERLWVKTSNKVTLAE